MSKTRQLNLGCGDDYVEGWLNVDIRRKGPGNTGKEVQTDIQADLNHFPWPFENDSFDYILFDNVLEHLDNQLRALEELYRISRSGGTVEIAGPHWNSPAAWRDPTHVRPFDYRTFEHHLTDHLFDVNRVELWKIGKAKYIPDSVALWLADHIGHVVGGFRVFATVKK